jgi:hypothetical protein
MLAPKPRFVAPRHLPAKAPYGSPCNNCGRCCVAKPCELSRAIWAADVCPAIESSPAGFGCGLMRVPLRYVGKLRRHGTAKLVAAARLILRSGLGCDARYDGEANAAFDKTRADFRVEHAAALRKARKMWGL